MFDDDDKDSTTTEIEKIQKGDSVGLPPSIQEDDTRRAYLLSW